MAQLKYRINAIKEKLFSIKEDHNLTASSIKSETTYAIDIVTRFEQDPGSIDISFDFKLLLRNNKEVVLMHYAASMNYEVLGYDLPNNSSESISLPAEVMNSIVGATYSTFRGIIYSRCGSSVLREATLPLINPSFFLDKVSEVNATAKSETLSKG